MNQICGFQQGPNRDLILHALGTIPWVYPREVICIPHANSRSPGTRINAAAQEYVRHPLQGYSDTTMRAFSSAFAALALFTAAAQAGKRGLTWPWCKLPHVTALMEGCTDHLVCSQQPPVNIHTSPLPKPILTPHSDPGVFNNGDGQVVAMCVEHLAPLVLGKILTC